MSNRAYAIAGTMALVAGLFVTTALTGMSSATEIELKADLNGENELDATTLEPGAGDPDGQGDIEVELRRRSVCFEATWQKIGKPLAGHIHSGSATQNGPVVVDLGSGVQSFEHEDGAGEATGCVRGVSRALVRDIAMHPARYYVNIHNARFPAGAIRGQLEM